MRALATATFALLALGACERPQPARRAAPPFAGTTPPPTVQPAPAAATAADAPLPAPTASTPPVLFQLGAPIRFKAGPPLKAKLIAKNAEGLALSPDGQSFVTNSWQTVKLVTPTNPAGYDVPSAASTLARFSSDGSMVAVYDSSITVLEVATGKKLLELDGYPSCALAFAPDRTLVFHGEATMGNEWLSPVYRVRPLPGSQPVEVGPKRFTRECAGAPDGSRFIAVFPTPYQLIDGATGRSRVLPIPDGAEVTVSPTAERYCMAVPRSDVQDLSCVRIADGGVETVLVGASYPSIDFEVGGQRALVERTLESPRGDITRELFLADFPSATLRRIEGFEGKSGSIRKLMPGGHLLTQGSSRGQMVYDLDRGQKRFISIPRLYGSSAMPGHERRFFADAETFGGQDNAELYLVEVP